MKNGDWVLGKNRCHNIEVWNTKNSTEKKCVCFTGIANVEQSHGVISVLALQYL